MNMKRFGGVLSLYALMLSIGHAQQLQPGQSPAPTTTAGTPLSRDHNGWRLYDVSASTGYSTLALPITNTFAAYSLERLESDYDGIASASFGYNYKSGRGTVSLLYTPSYVARVRYSQLNTLNQNLNITASRSLTPRLTLAGSLVGTDATLDQLLFAPAVLSVATNPVANVDDLIGAVRGGQYTSDQLASILTGTPYVVTPARSIIYGSHYVTAGLTSTLTYRMTARLNLIISGGATRSQTRSNSNVDAFAQTNFLVPKTTTENGSVLVNYLLTPRTEVGVQGSGALVDSSLGRYLISSGSVLVNRKLTPHWFVSASAGPSALTWIRQNPRYTVSVRPGGLGYTAVGTIGHSVRSHALLGSFSRITGDTFGLGSNTTEMFAGSWQWKRPGLSWGFFASGGSQKILGGGLGDLRYGFANGGVSRAMSRQFSLTFTFGYVDRRVGESIFVPQTQQNLSGYSTRLAIVWSPHGQSETSSRSSGPQPSTTIR